jgi:large subunit ribosomal protein L30
MTTRARSEAGAHGKRLRVTQVRSVINRPKDQKSTVRRLGLHRINDTVVKDDRPEIRGMIEKVRHLVEVEEVSEAESAKRSGGVKEGESAKRSGGAKAEESS